MKICVANRTEKCLIFTTKMFVLELCGLHIYFYVNLNSPIAKN